MVTPFVVGGQAGITPLVMARGGPSGGSGGGGSSTVGSSEQSPRGEEEEEKKTSVLVDQGINPTISLDAFLRNYQSEDDASFGDLAEKMREAHRRKYWWVYEHPALEAGKEKLYLLTDGSFMTEEQRKFRDKAVNAEPKRGDDRPNAPEGNVYRARNGLMFLPDQEQARLIHKVGQPSSSLPLLLTDGVSRALTTHTGSNSQVGLTGKGPREVAHKNTRLEEGGGEGGILFAAPSPIELARSDLSSLSSESTAPAAVSSGNQGFVPMTPVVVPGGGGQSPFITWGDIEGTPLRVTESFEPSSSRGFRINQGSYREKLATSLENKARRRPGSSTPLVYHRDSTTTITTPTTAPSRKRGPGALTPAAESLARKLAEQSNQSSHPFGGAASQLRESYANKKSTTGGGSTMSTPMMPLRRMATPSGSGSAKALKGTSVTDNLLA